MAPSSSPFSSNLLFPSSSPYPSSPSIYFLIPHPKTQSLNNFRALKIKISCSHQTIQIDTQQINPPKKKRKPRPSFSEQIRDKWSVKTTSFREKLPWEEQIQERKSIEEVQKGRHISGDVLSESRIDVNSVSDSVDFGSAKRVILAPWVQRSKPKKTQFDSEVGTSENHHEKGKRDEGFRGHCEKQSVVSSSVKELNNLVKGVNYDGKFDGVYVKVDSAPIKGKLSKIDKEIHSFEGSSDQCDSVKLPWRRESAAAPTGLSEKKRILNVNVDEGDSYKSKSSSIDKEIHNVEGSSDQCDSTRLALGGENYLKFVEVDRLRKRLPWERERVMKESKTMLGEKLIPEPELKRLRNVALRMVERIKVGAAGITQGLVDSIHEKWKEDEVVKLKFEGAPSLNMTRTHEILESRTGGLVIWRSGSSVVLFRGMTYMLHCVQSYTQKNQANVKISHSSRDLVNDFIPRVGEKGSTSSLESSRADSSRYLKDLSQEELMDLSELNLLLDELGPRFKDWSGRDPLPVDADLLPSVIPGYRCTFRLLPYGTRYGLRDKEMTFFRRSARTMPPHFALGRNRELQGLAAAMVKLWEKSAIAKIAIKRGVHNTSNERMAEELKILTGGTLVSRNKDYIVFYRGNDFLPPGVTKALDEAHKLAVLQQDEEDKARKIASTLIASTTKAKGPLVAGTLAETMAATSRWGNQPSSEEREKMMKDSALARHASLVRFLEKKLALANGKVKKAEKALQKVQEYLEPAELPTDLETLSDEERFLFRKIGLSMKPFLLLGRRGIFDGTVENMHLHWKYRELVKIIVDGKRFAQVKHIAISLEAESGGVLVSLDKTTKGYAIIVYRGKNYQRPSAVRPKNLLTRRQALARSIELQRREALKHHMSELRERIENLKPELEDMKTVKEIDEATLYSRVDNASDDDDDIDDYDDNMDEDEDEDEEAYLEIYDSGNEDDNS